LPLKLSIYVKSTVAEATENATTVDLTYIDNFKDNLKYFKEPFNHDL